GVFMQFRNYCSMLSHSNFFIFSGKDAGTLLHSTINPASSGESSGRICPHDPALSVSFLKPPDRRYSSPTSSEMPQEAELDEVCTMLGSAVSLFEFLNTSTCSTPNCRPSKPPSICTVILWPTRTRDTHPARQKASFAGNWAHLQANVEPTTKIRTKTERIT
ncbi:hypothetical protein PFISCL1PPCAC_13850, partial [Pristionchus fissidentatus]